mmetsp:Transcript_27964/g.64775  ORF Transcript_27964/g.64775 Transcript_27964/m.64775 type:complete len:83 (+) Transcript_27964:337-585(+)
MEHVRVVSRTRVVSPRGSVQIMYGAFAGSTKIWNTPTMATTATPLNAAQAADALGFEIREDARGSRAETDADPTTHPNRKSE